MKKLGNSAFKAGNLHDGIEKYQKGLRYLDEPHDPNVEEEGEVTKTVSALRLNLHLNSALLQLKLMQYPEAIKSATAVLNGKPTETETAKALYRRGLARIALKSDDEAELDFEAALKHAPGDPAITKELENTKKRNSDQIKKEKAAAKKFFE